jgi:3-hydroxybutyrate dehydrogenase
MNLAPDATSTGRTQARAVPKSRAAPTQSNPRGSEACGLEADADEAGHDQRIEREEAQQPGQRGPAEGAEACEDEDTENVHGRYDGGVGHRRQGDALGAKQPGRHGDAHVVVEPDAALEDRGERGALEIQEAPAREEKARDQERRGHQHGDERPDGNALQRRGHEAVDEEGRQQDVVAEPFRLGPERLAEEARSAQGRAEADEEDDGQKRQQDRAGHGSGLRSGPQGCVGLAAWTRFHHPSRIEARDRVRVRVARMGCKPWSESPFWVLWSARPLSGVRPDRVPGYAERSAHARTRRPERSLPMTLKNKTAAVTGSTSGIGLGMARAYAAQGANIVLNGFGKPEDIEAARSGIESTFGVRAIHSNADMTKPAEIEGFVKLAEETFGSLDILVNNAGMQFVSPIEDFPVEKWDLILALNLSSAFHTMRAAIPGMKQRGWGRIINTASAHSMVASPFKSAYVAAKHGLVGLSKAAALELATHGITVNCISPGYVWTPLVESQIPDTMKARGMTEDEVINEVLLKAQPTKEFVTIDQVAALAVFLASDAASQITGANMAMDGGWTAQ